jgi:hypothetical protein
MSDPADDADGFLYPNRDDDGRIADGRDARVSRRRPLAGSMAAGMAATTGCAGSGSDAADTDDGESSQPAVVVFNTGDATVSVVDPTTDELVTTQHVGLTSSFPSNQYIPRPATSPDESLWLNVGRGVRAVSAGSFTERARLDTESGAN